MIDMPKDAAAAADLVQRKMAGERIIIRVESDIAQARRRLGDLIGEARDARVTFPDPGYSASLGRRMADHFEFAHDD